MDNWFEKIWLGFLTLLGIAFVWLLFLFVYSITQDAGYELGWW